MMVGRRSVTNAASGPVHPFFTMLKATPKEKALKNPLVPDVYKYSVKEAWFSDPAVYPLFAAWGATLFLIVGMVRLSFDHSFGVFACGSIVTSSD